MTSREEASNVRVFGPTSMDGGWLRGLKPKADGSLPDGFKVSTRRVVTPNEAISIGRETEDLFYTQFRRDRRWSIHEVALNHGKKIRSYDSGGHYDSSEANNLPKAYLAEYPTSANRLRHALVDIPEGGSMVIPQDIKYTDLDILKGEVISERLALMIEAATLVEKLLPDYGAAGENLFRNWGGLNLSYHQWIEQEAMHPKGLDQILLRVGVRDEATGEIRQPYRTPEQLRVLRERLLIGVWIESFDTPRKMTLFPVPQEFVTAKIYQAGAVQASAEGATTVAKILDLVGADEQDHYNWFNQATRVFSRHDHDGTEQDFLKVAAHFQMPADTLLPERGKRLASFQQVGVSFPAFARNIYKVGQLLNTDTHEVVDLGKLRVVVSTYAGIDPEDDKAFKETILTHPTSAKVI